MFLYPLRRVSWDNGIPVKRVLKSPLKQAENEKHSIFLTTTSCGALSLSLQICQKDNQHHVVLVRPRDDTAQKKEGAVYEQGPPACYH